MLNQLAYQVFALYLITETEDKERIPQPGCPYWEHPGCWPGWESENKRQSEEKARKQGEGKLGLVVRMFI